MAWLAAAVLLGVVGWIKSINLVLILAYLMATLLFFNGLLAWMQVRRVKVTRTPTPPVTAGEASSVHLTATNPARRTATVVVEKHAGDVATSWLISRLPGGASASCSTQLRFPKRGRFPSSLRVSSGFPFGLVQYQRVITTEPPLVVLPATGTAEATGMRQWLLRRAGGDGRARKVLRRITTDQADVRGVRPYRPGDPIRGIHWRSSARCAELMVREYDAAPSPDLVLVVEPWIPANPLPDHTANLEAALSLAVTIALTWSRAYGTRVSVAVAGDPESLGTAESTDSGVRAALAPLAGVVGANRFETFARRVFDRSLLRAARVVVSSRSDSPYAAALTRSTGQPFLAVSPTDYLPWYQPPATRGQKTENRGQKPGEDEESD
jgi:uncharacterized protein (DUF58 family)